MTAIRTASEITFNIIIQLSRRIPLYQKLAKKILHLTANSANSKIPWIK